MAASGTVFRWQTITGQRIDVQGNSLALQARALTVGWGPFGFVWSRPVAVLVGRGGVVTRLPVHDVTRYVQLGLLGLAAGVALAALVGPNLFRSASS